MSLFEEMLQEEAWKRKLEGAGYTIKKLPESADKSTGITGKYGAVIECQTCGTMSVGGSMCGCHA